MPDFYLDPKNGDDGHAGTSAGTARQTLSGIFGIGTFPANPITSTVTIKVVGTAEAPGLCETAAAEFDLSDRAFSGGGALIVEPDGWDQTEYEAGRYPFTTGSGSFDSRAAKTAVVPKPVLPATGADKITFRGVEIRAMGDAKDHAFSFEAGDAQPLVYYCQITGFDIGIKVHGTAFDATNLHFVGNRLGIEATKGAEVTLSGGCAFTDNAEAGVVAAGGSIVSASPWNDDPNRAKIVFRTTQPRTKYAAVRLVTGSSLSLYDPYADPDGKFAAYLQVLNESGLDAEEYYGVLIESQSSFVGAGRVFFGDPGVMNGAATVASGRQIVAKPGEGGTVLR
jgi:hypothetical protein